MKNIFRMFKKLEEIMHMLRKSVEDMKKETQMELSLGKKQQNRIWD